VWLAVNKENESESSTPNGESPKDELPMTEIVEAELVEQPTPEGDLGSASQLGLDLPEDAEEALPIVLAALAQAREDADQYLDDLRRVAADFDNFRKRTQREMAALVERASERVVRQLLPVLDSFDAALGFEPKSDAEEKLVAGIRNTYELLLDVLLKEGLEPIEAWNQPFDPTVHEAVLTTGEGQGPLMVAQELRRGYRLRDKVLRAALVAVAPEESTTE